MLEPKNTSVELAGQKAWHICVGEAAPRISGKYFPSQLRTQKLGPGVATTEPSITGRGGGGGCRLVLEISAKNVVWGCCLWLPLKKIEQAFGQAHLGRQRHGTNDRGGNHRHL